MREISWESRVPTYEHERRFNQLLTLHELTLAWLEAIQLAHKMDRGLQARGLGNLRLLDLLGDLSRDRSMERTRKATQRWGLEQFMDDTSPNDVVQRLEYGISVTQAHTLRQVLDSVAAEERTALWNVLEQASWRTGRARAEARWPWFPDDLRADLRGLFQAASDSPFLGASQPGGILLERSLRSSIIARFPLCAHRSRFAEVHSIADELCELHAHWLRGFAYALQPRARIRTERSPQGCAHHWEAVNTP